MAFTEDLITRVRADTADFEAGVRRASDSIQTFSATTHSSVTRSTAGYIRFGNASRAAAMAVEGFAAGGDRAAYALAALGPQLTSMTAGALGASGSAGSLATTLLKFAGPAGIAITVAAGLYELAKAFGKTGDKAGEAEAKAAAALAAIEAAWAAGDKGRVATKAQADRVKEAMGKEKSARDRDIDALLKTLIADEKADEADEKKATEVSDQHAEALQKVRLEYEKLIGLPPPPARTTAEQVNLDFAQARAYQEQAAAIAQRLDAELEAAGGRVPLGGPEALVPELSAERNPFVRDAELEAALQAVGLRDEETKAMERQAETMAVLENRYGALTAKQMTAEGVSRQQLRVWKALGQAATDQVATTIAMSIAQGKGAGAIIQAVRAEATVMALKEAALSLSSYAWGNVASGTLHAQSAAMWTAIAAVSGLAGGFAGGGGGGGGRRLASGERGSARELAEDRRRREEEERRGGLSFGPSSIGSERARGQPLEVNIYVPIGGRQAGAREIAAALRELSAEDGRTVNEIFSS